MGEGRPRLQNLNLSWGLPGICRMCLVLYALPSVAHSDSWLPRCRVLHWAQYVCPSLASPLNPKDGVHPYHSVVMSKLGPKSRRQRGLHQMQVCCVYKTVCSHEPRHNLTCRRRSCGAVSTHSMARGICWPAI